jgi:cardiolipin synthase (CMP-forming)
VLKQLRAAPNLLTFMRLCLIPFLLLATLDSHYRSALCLFLVAGLSDGLDGLAARWFKQQTQLGQYLDPVADKLLLSTLFLALTHQELVPVRVTVLVFSRDLGILIVAALLYASLGIRDFRPSILGKANTGTQVIALFSVLLCQVYGPPPLLLLRDLSLKATMALTVLSALHYAWRTARRLPAAEQTAG